MQEERDKAGIHVQLLPIAIKPPESSHSVFPSRNFEALVVQPGTETSWSKLSGVLFPMPT